QSSSCLLISANGDAGTCPHPRSPVLYAKGRLSLDGNIAVVLHYGLLFLLRHRHLQDAVLELRLDILLLHIVAHIEASAAGSRVALSTDVTSVLLLLFLLAVGGSGDGKVAVLQLCLDVLLLHA